MADPPSGVATPDLSNDGLPPGAADRTLERSASWPGAAPASGAAAASGPSGTLRPSAGPSGPSPSNGLPGTAQVSAAASSGASPSNGLPGTAQVSAAASSGASPSNGLPGGTLGAIEPLAEESERRHSQDNDEAPPPAPKPRSAAKDPWRLAVPKELRSLRSAIRAGARGSDQTIAQLRRYNREHASDPRGHLLLAGLYLNREWRADAINQYSLAYQIDPSSRGAPEMLANPLAMIVRGTAVSSAERLIEQVYRREALASIERALRARDTDARAKTRLTNLKARLLARPR
jgi:hypothetical protein